MLRVLVLFLHDDPPNDILLIQKLAFVGDVGFMHYFRLLEALLFQSIFLLFREKISREINK
ncbi:hypothetical protein BSG1_16005 [Bacillus sp. SG-1]|nr:hypothetical protein BSG1_16005 [Bacillus sp. SG-1]